MGIIADFGDALARRLTQCVFDRELPRSIRIAAGADPSNSG
jgi:hypothetical protein